MLFRIDSHQHFTAQHPEEHFGPILARNKFAGSVCVVNADDPWSVAEFDFVLAILVRSEPGHWREHPKYRGLVCVAPASRPVDFGSLDLPNLDAAAKWAERFPEQRIAVDHMGSPDITGADFTSWARQMETAARYPQVYCKLSGLVRLAPAPWKAETLRPYVHHALRCFGPERCMFGSGWPDCLPEYGWKETLAAFTQALGAAPIPVREQLLGGTAARFYNIAGPPADPAL